jgi:hypothetical protein
MRKLELLFICTLLINCPGNGASCEAGSCSFKAEAAVSSSVLQDTARLNQVLYNGKIWLGRYFNVYGTEFMIEDKFYRADISVNDIRFNNVEVKYDIYNDDLLVNYYNRRIIILNRENVEEFTLYTGDRELLFRNMRERNGLKGYYQVIYEDNSRLLKKWRKKRAQFVIEARYDEFQPDDVLVLVKDKETYQVKNRRRLLKIFGDNKREIRNFIRRENIHLDFKQPETIIPVLEFYDSL